MKGIIIVSYTGSVVFHTAPFTRDLADHIVAVVESEIHTQASHEYADAAGVAAAAAGATPAQQLLLGQHAQEALGGAFVAASSLRTATLHRHGGHGSVAAARWLETTHKRVCDGVVTLFSSEHAWLAAAVEAESSAGGGGEGDVSDCVLLYWRKVGDKVFIFALEPDESLCLARLAMSNLIRLLSEAFKCKTGEMPGLKEMLARSEVVQACCSCVAPQHVLALVDISVARVSLQRLLAKPK